MYNMLCYVLFGVCMYVWWTGWLTFEIWLFCILYSKFGCSISCFVFCGVSVCRPRKHFGRSNGAQVLRETNGRPNLFLFLYWVFLRIFTKCCKQLHLKRVKLHNFWFCLARLKEIYKRNLEGRPDKDVRWSLKSDIAHL